MHRICAEGLFALLQLWSQGCCRNRLPPPVGTSRQEAAEVEARRRVLSEAVWMLGASGPGCAVSVIAFPRWDHVAAPLPSAQGMVGLPRDSGEKLPGLLLHHLGNELGSFGRQILGHRTSPQSSRCLLSPVLSVSMSISLVYQEEVVSSAVQPVGMERGILGEKGSAVKGIINSLSHSTDTYLASTVYQDVVSC